MRRSGGWPLMMIDCLGGSTLAACALGFAWLTFLRETGPTATIAELQQTAAAAARDLSGLSGMRDQQRSVVAARRQELADRGRLPDQAPIEAYFQTLAALAAEHHLQIRRHHPLAPRVYPGLLEQRFAYEVTGRVPDLTGFLAAVEHTVYWADVSYLKIDRGDEVKRGLADQRVAQLTFSLFAALPPDPTPKEPSTGSSGKDAAATDGRPG